MYKACVITVSDRAYSGVYEDKSGPAVRDLLNDSGYEVTDITVIPDDLDTIKEALLAKCGQGVHLIITTGGTGFADHDVTPEATRSVIEKEAPGIAEYMRQKSTEITPRAILSRGTAGIRGRSLIINLPGSPKGAVENLSFVLPHLAHGLDMLSGVRE